MPFKCLNKSLNNILIGKRMIKKAVQRTTLRHNQEAGLLFLDAWASLLVGSILIMTILSITTGLIWQLQRSYLYDGMVQKVITFMEDGKADYVLYKKVEPIQELYKGFSYERYVEDIQVLDVPVKELHVKVSQNGVKIYEVRTLLYDSKFHKVL